MRTLRAKLFLNITFVLLIVAALNYTLPEIWFRRELSRASQFLNEHVATIQEKTKRFSSFLMMYKMVEGATELDGIARVQSSGKNGEGSIWDWAQKIASANPGIAFVEVIKEGKSAHISIEDTPLYSPLWAPFEKGKLWIKIEERGLEFIAIPSEGGYLLYETLEASGNFTPFVKEEVSFSWQDSIEKIFQSMQNRENEWVEKIELIGKLLPWQEKGGETLPAGFLKVDQGFKRGVALLREDALSTTLLVKNISTFPDAILPTLFLHKGENGSYLDMVKVFGDHSIACGFSLSSIVQKIAQILEKAIIIHWKEGSLGFTKSGKEFDPSREPFPYQDYAVLTIDLKLVELNLYTPKQEATALSNFLTSLYSEVSWKVSLSLIGGVLISFFIALILLNNVSKKITKPITLLSHAFEELGKGKYEGLILPNVKGREDEVGVLVASFKKMVQAFQDRDKIRGVLNKVVSKEISEEILRHTIELGGEERVITMLFSDIRNFTHYSENLKPKDLLNTLNAYMNRMCRIIDETKGVVDKFVGDEIMALYGAPIALPNHAVHAIESALRMIQDLKKEVIFDIGIGIHTGLVSAGNVGAENRLNYTVLGANVNLSSRICSVAKPMQILISEATYKEPGVQEKFQFQKLPPISLKGIDHPVQLYEVLT